MMFDLFVASDAVRRRMMGSLEPEAPRAPKARPVRRRRTAVRSTSAAALRTLADRLEPSPT
jgi:hypothetical protein